jgi:hypothetical protein
MPLTRASRISETKASDGVLEGLIPESPLLCVKAVANHLWFRFIIAFFRRAFCCFRFVLHHILHVHLHIPGISTPSQHTCGIVHRAVGHLMCHFTCPSPPAHSRSFAAFALAPSQKHDPAICMTLQP